MKKQNMNNEKYKNYKVNFNVGARLRPCPSRRNSQRGITLIALIITIIILLILAVVSIRLVMNNGILGKAETATENYVVSEEKEQIQIGYSDYQMAKASGEANPELKVAGATVEGEESTGWTITFEKTGNVYQFNGTNISANGPWTQKENAEGETIIENGKTGQTLKIGDYVNYDPTEGATTTSVTSYSAENGYGDQTFNLASYKNAGYGWRVLGIENGKIQLISEEFIGPDEGGCTNTTYNRTYYELQVRAGYINGINELNKISAMYGQGKGAEGARSITVEDVNKITGYNPEKTGAGEPYGKGKFYEYGNEITYSWSSGKVAYSSKNGSGTSSYTTFKYYDESTRTFVYLPTDKTITLKSTAYFYLPATLSAEMGKPTTGVNEDGTYNTELEMLFGSYKINDDSVNNYREFTGTGAPQDYWLASSYVFTSSGNADFGLHIVDDGSVMSSIMYGSDGYPGHDYFGVRSVVSLKSDIQLEYNSTAQEWEIK